MYLRIIAYTTKTTTTTTIRWRQIDTDLWATLFYYTSFQYHCCHTISACTGRNVVFEVLRMFPAKLSYRQWNRLKCLWTITLGFIRKKSDNHRRRNKPSLLHSHQTLLLQVDSVWRYTNRRRVAAGGNGLFLYETRYCRPLSAIFWYRHLLVVTCWVNAEPMETVYWRWHRRLILHKHFEK